MKIKRLLSIGAFALVLACSTSVGASAVVQPVTTLNELQKREVFQKLAQTYGSGKSPINNVAYRNLSPFDMITITQVIQDIRVLDTLTGSQKNDAELLIRDRIRSEIGDSVNVIFGKNGFNQTTVSVQLNNQIIFQANTNDIDLDIVSPGQPPAPPAQG